MANPQNWPDRRLQPVCGVVGTIEATPAEPVFILRARDSLAAEAVRDWAARAADAGVDPRKVKGALDIADAMDAWPTKKLPD